MKGKTKETRTFSSKSLQSFAQKKKMLEVPLLVLESLVQKFHHNIYDIPSSLHLHLYFLVYDFLIKSWMERRERVELEKTFWDNQ